MSCLWLFKLGTSQFKNCVDQDVTQCHCQQVKLVKPKHGHLLNQIIIKELKCTEIYVIISKFFRFGVCDPTLSFPSIVYVDKRDGGCKILSPLVCGL